MFLVSKELADLDVDDEHHQLGMMGDEYDGYEFEGEKRDILDRGC